MTRTARVVAASNRAASGVYADKTGPLITGWLRDQGYDVPPAEVVPDGEPVRDALRSAVAAGVDVVITTGGTGISPTDRTPEMTAAVRACRPCPRRCCRADGRAWRGRRSW
jgi:molybdenum cofactor synthesis domain-containing protein